MNYNYFKLKKGVYELLKVYTSIKMDFFDELSKKATKAFEITKEKTTQLSKEVQLRNKVYRNKNKIE